MEHDPFDDTPGHKHEASADSQKSVYGQLLTYAARVRLSQHRKHLFLLFVNGPEFRVMYFDQGGVITSEAIDYVSTVEGTAALLAFLHAFHRLDDAQQGIDTIAIPLDPASCGYKRMDALKEAHEDDFDHHARYVKDPASVPSSIRDTWDPPVVVDAKERCLHCDPADNCSGPECRDEDAPIYPVFIYVRDAFRRSIEAGETRYAVKVGDHHYLIGRYMTDPPTSSIGGGTKWYVALEWETQRFVFLKDTWRSDYTGIEREGDILEKLNEKGVYYVPTVIAHGDVEDQETETSNYSPVTGQKKVEACPPYLELLKEKKRLANTVRSRMQGKAKVAASTVATIASEDGHGNFKKRTADERTTEENSEQGYGIRHLIHYRLVVKQICLTLTDLEHSWQLVSIIRDCIVGM